MKLLDNDIGASGNEPLSPATEISAIAFNVAKPSEIVASNQHCRAKAIEIVRNNAPATLPTFDKIMKSADAKNNFYFFLDCNDLGQSLSSAIHEAVHGLSGVYFNPHCFPLRNGTSASCPYGVMDARLLQPKTIFRDYPFDAQDPNVKTYLLGIDLASGEPIEGSSGGTDFNMILNELNAWTHDVAFNTELHLKGIAPAISLDNSRLGAMQLMTFAMAYLHFAKKKSPSTWKMLIDPREKKLITQLWQQAEPAIEASCKVPQKGVHKPSLNFLCDPKYQEGIESIVGQKVSCPLSCR
jgi:hypothetical protein